MITQTVTNSFQAELLEGVHDFNTDTFKIALYLATADLDANTTVYVTGGETSGTGYTAGGNVMTGISVNAAGFVNFIRQAYPNPNSLGIPKYYALFGPTTTNDNPPLITNELSFILGPTPDATYSVELHYYYYPESIVTAGNTWLGDNFDSVLLYGALVEAGIFMKAEAETLTVYQKKYEEAVAQAKRLGDGMERQDAYRSGQYRQAVV